MKLTREEESSWKRVPGSEDCATVQAGPSVGAEHLGGHLIHQLELSEGPPLVDGVVHLKAETGSAIVTRNHLRLHYNNLWGFR